MFVPNLLRIRDRLAICHLSFKDSGIADENKTVAIFHDWQLSE